MSLILDKEKGVNPHMTYCPRCKGESSELMLLGARDRVYTCESCGGQNFGGITKNACGICGAYMSVSTSPKRVLGANERLPASEPCAECKEEIAEHLALVEAGGVYWRCMECGRDGSIKASDFATEVRAAHTAQGDADLSSAVDGKYPPCGVQFENCAEHGPMPVEATDGEEA